MKKIELKERLFNAKQKAEIFISGAALAIASSPMAISASGPSKIVKDACDIVVDMFPFIGAFFVVAGVFKLILAYRNDQPEAQAGAAKDIVIGAVFIVFKTFVWAKLSGSIFGGL